MSNTVTAHPPLLSLAEAIAILDNIVTAISPPPHEQINVRDSLNRTLAVTQLSRLDLPPFNKSAMDGYAIAYLTNDLINDNNSKKIISDEKNPIIPASFSHEDNRNNVYNLIETVAAGTKPTQKLHANSNKTIKVMTGAPVPTGTTVVVPIEMATEYEDGRVIINELPHSSNICQQGEDMRCNDIALTRGALIDPIAIANLIACGITSISVHRKLRVAIVTTGNEIVDDIDAITFDSTDADIQNKNRQRENTAHINKNTVVNENIVTDINIDKNNSAKIMNSNGPMLHALCRKYGLDVITNINVPDNYTATITALQKVLEQADIVLISGGVSTGDFDFVTAALATLKLQVHFSRVAIKPGKPITFASTQKNTMSKSENISSKLVFGLPGNPVAVYLTFHLFALRAIQIILGNNSVINSSITDKNTNKQHMSYHYQLPLSQPFKRSATAATRTEYIPCRILHDGTLLPIKSHGSAHLAALLHCDGFGVIPAHITNIAAGDKINFFAIHTR